ncbi:MAG: hypothetical protein ACRDE8_14830 [Ginsengibacter sp.]
MPVLNYITKLDNYEAEDIGDVVAKLEKSFQIKFDKNAFKEIDNFGKLCDVIEATLKYDEKEDCTKQQAFYKIREAIRLTRPIGKEQIKLETKLSDLFPKQNRRKQVVEFQKHLEVKLKFLTYPDWVTLILLVGLLASLVAFFFDWKIAVSGIVICTLAFRVADKLGKDLQFETVKQLTEKVAREHYINIRRSTMTMNKSEIFKIIKDAFSYDLSIDKEHLTREAAFSWTKSTATNKSNLGDH